MSVIILYFVFSFLQFVFKYFSRQITRLQCTLGTEKFSHSIQYQTVSFVYYYSTISYNTNVTLNNGTLDNDLFVGTIDLGWATLVGEFTYSPINTSLVVILLMILALLLIFVVCSRNHKWVQVGNESVTLLPDTDFVVLPSLWSAFPNKKIAYKS